MITGPGAHVDGSGRRRVRPGGARLRDRLAQGRASTPDRRSVRLLEVPIDVAHTTRQVLRERTADARRPETHDHHTVVADQVRELSVALRRTAHGLSDIVDLMLSAARDARHDDSSGPTVTIDLAVAPHDTRAAADILMTIDHLAALGGTPVLTIAADVRGLATWIADEIDTQTDGDPPTAYGARHRPVALPCPLLRAAMGHHLGQATIHAYRHSGWTGRQVTTVRESPLAATLVTHPGATLDELLAWSRSPRLDLLIELGDLIELRAIFGIDHHWYPYDITALALLDGRAARVGCACPTTIG